MEQQLFFISSIAGILLLANIMGYYIFKFKRNFEAEQARRIKYKKMSERLQRELNTIQAELEQKQNEANRLQENLQAERASRITESEQLQRELATIQTELGQKQNEINHLEENLQAEQTESQRLRHELATTEVELEEQKNEGNHLEENLKAEQASRRQYEKESERLQHELNTIQVELGEKENEVNRLEENLQEEQAESEQLQRELNTTQLELRERENEVNRLQGNLQEEQAKSGQLQRELKTIQTELEEQKNTINHLEENFQEERENRIHYEAKTEKLQRELKTTQEELQDNKNKVNCLENNLEAERETRIQYETASERLQHELSTIQAELKKQKKEINRLEKKIKEKSDNRASTEQSDIQELEENSTDSAKPRSQEGAEPDSSSDSKTDPAGEYATEKKTETGKIKKPRDIAGLRGSGSNGSEGSTDHQTEYNPRPELVCRKNGWQWEILLTVPEEQFPVEVRQNGAILPSINEEYRLDNFFENLTIIHENSKEGVELCNDESPLIFKLQKKWKGDGRKVRGISRGYFIIFAPNEWERQGNPPVAQEACSDRKFSAHYFYSDDSTTTDGFEGHELPSNQEGFSLRGSQIYDNSDQGLLFIGDPPDLKPTESVLWARIGEEGGEGWKGENFRPSERNMGEVLKGRQGWFYVRVYDEAAQLIESNDFRYSQTLKEIWVNGTMYSEEMLLVPSANGYMETIIQFIDTKGDNISPEKMGNNSHASIHDDDAIIVAPHPDGDLTEWKVGRVDTVISLPRIWWRITKTDNSSEEWRDTPIVMSRKEFRENTDAVVQISLPSNIEKIQVGFGFDLHRSYSTDDENQNKRRIELPIRDFVDYEEIEIPFSKNIYLNIQCNRKILPIICVPAEEPLLKKILINDTIYPDAMLLVPSTDGYTETISIRFIDAKGNNIRPKQKGNNSRVSICDDGAVIVAPPAGDLTKGPDSDLTEWNVDSLDKVVSLPRIWWRITKTNDFSDGWCDEPIVMPRQKFRRNMNAIVQISLPSSIYKIQAEFGSDFQRSYSYKPTTNNKNKRIFELPIRDLDYKEIERPSSKGTYLNIQCNEEKLPIIRVPAEGEICPECDSKRLTKINSDKDKLMWYQCQLCKWESQKYNVPADELQSAIQS